MKWIMRAMMLLIAGALLAAPHESSTEPLPNEARAIVAMHAFSTGPWVRGDWALKCYLLTGHGRERVKVPVEVIGGWRNETGRWQRMRLPNGRQWLIKDIPVSELTPANFSEARAAENPFGAALLPVTQIQNEKRESGRSLDPVAQGSDPQEGKMIAQEERGIESLPDKGSKKPAEGEMVLTQMNPPANKEIQQPVVKKETGIPANKGLELVFSGSRLIAASPGAKTIGITLEGRERGVPLVVQGSRMIAGVWELEANGRSHLLSAEERLNTINERLSLSWELYTMNFLNMPAIHYRGVQKVRARWCDTLELSGGEGPYAKALVWIDTEFGAPLQAELYDATGNLSKTVSAASIQRVRVPTGKDGATENEWVLKQWDVLDAATHGKVTVDVAAVSLDRAWQANLYSEKSPLKEWPEIREGEWNVTE